MLRLSELKLPHGKPKRVRTSKDKLEMRLELLTSISEESTRIPLRKDKLLS